MDILRHGISAIGKLVMAGSLAAAFLAGVFGVVYMQLTGTEVEIPKIVGKNFNEGQDELVRNGLRIKKIATRFSNEKPNTILEQRPRAGTVAKTGLIISVVVSEPNPPGTEAPTELKDDQEAIEEIQDLPELKTDKAKKQAKPSEKKDEPKTRDVIDDPKNPDGTAPSGDQAAPADAKSGDDAKPGDKPPGERNSPPPAAPKQDKPKADSAKPARPSPDVSRPATGADVRPRKTPQSNLRG